MPTPSAGRKHARLGIHDIGRNAKATPVMIKQPARAPGQCCLAQHVAQVWSHLQVMQPLVEPGNAAQQLALAQVHNLFLNDRVFRADGRVQRGQCLARVLREGPVEEAISGSATMAKTPTKTSAMIKPILAPSFPSIYGRFVLKQRGREYHPRYPQAARGSEAGCGRGRRRRSRGRRDRCLSFEN